MPTLKVTARGQVTFRKEILQHLGIRPGEKLRVELLPSGRAALTSEGSTGTLADFIGCLAGRTDKVASLDEIQTTIEDAWSGRTK